LLLERSAVFRNKCKTGECKHNLTSPIKLKFEFKLKNVTFENVEKVSSERKDDRSEANCDTPLDILELENMMSEKVVKVDSERKNA
jgi:hypothetical protein